MNNERIPGKIEKINSDGTYNIKDNNSKVHTNINVNYIGVNFL